MKLVRKKQTGKRETQYKSKKPNKNKKMRIRYRCQYYSLQIQRQILCISC